MSRPTGFICALILTLLISIVAGCGTKAAPQYIRYSVGTEPETVDPRKSTGLPEANVEAQIFEGLAAIDEKGTPIPATAEKWMISPDGLTYTFFLRPDAKWSNGDQVTAFDFEFAWKSALSPELGSKYAYQLFYVKNAEAYNNGKANADAVGVRAIDARTLQVTLEQPTAYFLSLTAFHTYYPVHKATVISNSKWAADPKTIIGNGPFKIVSWRHNSKIEFAKNENYWDAAKVKMAKMEFVLTDSSATELMMFETNLIDMGNNPPISEYSRLRSEGTLSIFPYIGTYFYCFNVTKPPFDNPKVRRAFTLALNRQAIISTITKGEQNVALAWVPFGLTDVASGSDFRRLGGDYFKDNDFATAKKLLAEAGYPDGVGLPPITLIYNTSENHKAIAEAVQEMWKKNLGVDVTLVNQEWKVFINTRNQGDYQVTRHGWIGDYADPMTFIDMFESTSGNNDAKYNNPAYDRLVRLAKSSNDQRTRMQAMHAAEELLINDAVIAPIYFYTDSIIIKPYVKGYIHSALGLIYFKEAYINN